MILALTAYKNKLSGRHFSSLNCDKHDQMQLFSQFKNILLRELGATLNFQKLRWLATPSMEFFFFIKSNSKLHLVTASFAVQKQQQLQYKQFPQELNTVTLEEV